MTEALATPRPVEWRVTCETCPWQVEGRLDDGRWFYFRHRSCSAQLGVGASLDEAVRQTFDERAKITYHEDNAPECYHNGFCSGLDGEEIAYVWQLLWKQRAELGL